MPTETITEVRPCSWHVGPRSGRPSAGFSKPGASASTERKPSGLPGRREQCQSAGGRDALEHGGPFRGFRGMSPPKVRTLNVSIVAKVRTLNVNMGSKEPDGEGSLIDLIHPYRL